MIKNVKRNKGTLQQLLQQQQKQQDMYNNRVHIPGKNTAISIKRKYSNVFKLMDHIHHRVFAMLIHAFKFKLCIVTHVDEAMMS